MNAQELLCFLTNRQIDSFFELVRKVPADKLDWAPGTGTRSTLSMVQEVSTALGYFMPGMKSRKMEWDDSMFGKWMADRSSVTSVDDLEARCRKETSDLCDYIRSIPEAELGDKVELPFPGEFNVATNVSYHYWNASYHEGQINTILQLLGTQS